MLTHCPIGWDDLQKAVKELWLKIKLQKDTVLGQLKKKNSPSHHLIITNNKVEHREKSSTSKKGNRSNINRGNSRCS